MGKGSRARPFDVPKDEFSNRWDAIFGKKDIKEEKKSDTPTKEEDSKKTK